jgi:hypothetical protein
VSSWAVLVPSHRRFQEGSRLTISLDPLFVPIHRSAWKDNSPKFAEKPEGDGLGS